MPVPIPQGHLIMACIGTQLVNQRLGGPTALSIEVNNRRFQLGVLKSQHPSDTAKCGLRQGHSVTRSQLLGAPRHDPQPRAVSGADLRQRLDNVGDEQRPRLRELQLFRIGQRLVD